MAEDKAKALWANPEEAPAPTRDGAEVPIQVVLVWTGIGDLHRGFFSDPDVVSALGVGLSGQVEPPANVHVRYDNEEFLGHLRLQLLPNTLRAKVQTTSETIQLQDLAGITAPLAAYRSAIGGRFDLRVNSFRVGIESYRGANVCIFGVTGTPPPDGRIVSPCVEINGAEHCGEARPDGVVFEPKALKTIRTCLDLD